MKAIFILNFKRMYAKIKMPPRKILGKIFVTNTGQKITFIEHKFWHLRCIMTFHPQNDPNRYTLLLQNIFAFPPGVEGREPREHRFRGIKGDREREISSLNISKW